MYYSKILFELIKMKQISFFKTFSIINISIVLVILILSGFSIFLIYSDISGISRVVPILNSVAYTLPLLIYAYRNKKSDWVQYNGKRLNLKIAGTKTIIKRKEILTVKTDTNLIKIQLKTRTGILLNLKNYNARDISTFKKILKNRL